MVLKKRLEEVERSSQHAGDGLHEVGEEDTQVLDEEGQGRVGGELLWVQVGEEKAEGAEELSLAVQAIRGGYVVGESCDDALETISLFV